MGNERGTKTADDNQTQEPDSGVPAPGNNMSPGDDADKLNQVGKTPRLTGPGVRASKQSAARTDAATLGRERRSR